MPGLVSCPGGLIVIGILSLCVVHISSEIWSNEVSDVQYGSLGSSVTLTCGGAQHGSPVHWRHNGSTVQFRHTHTSNGTLILHNTTRSMEGNYSCHNQRGVLLQTIRLRLGHSPGYLNVSCRVPSHFIIHCFWTQRVTTHLPTNYITTYSVNDERAQHCKQTSMDVNECTINNHEFWKPKCLVNITEVNPLGSNSTIIYVDVQKSMKPHAPEAVTALEVPGESTRLLVQWNFPQSWPVMAGLPLKFELQYKPVGSNYWSKLETEDTSVQIMDALESHLHHIRVRAQDALINYSQWSEWSQVVQAQPWSDPLVTAEVTTDEPFDFPIFPSTFPVRATEKSPDLPPSENGSLGLLITLGLFAAVMVAVVSSVTTLLWIRNRRRDNVTKQELTSMVKMKSLPV
ncbi:interleukin-11 receptor subunit alpha [Astyanax mexicanus]|uniref:interleukin-11 receptor subunit alpha n=1 Tax=Astyanax mexicanus TaxID=7994 RepID=UPI0020CB25DE|nr:interleukin-11 receptor subunit alpha [Astyanax mexicanus]